MKHKQIFISGIDTDCGKTYITGLLAYHMRKSGINCITSKLVQTGCTGIADDIIEHRRIMEIDLLAEDENKLTCPFVYSFPASPHLSAEIDQRPFELEKVNEAFISLQQNYELILTEGAGGIAVPLTKEILSTVYVKENHLPLVLVSSSKLGSINHTLLSIDYCMNNNIELKTVVYSQFPDDDQQIANSSFEVLKEFLARNYSEIKLIHSKNLQKNYDFELSDLIS